MVGKKPQVFRTNRDTLRYQSTDNSVPRIGRKTATVLTAL